MRDNSKITEIHCRTSLFKSSVFPHTIGNWNRLLETFCASGARFDTDRALSAGDIENGVSVILFLSTICFCFLLLLLLLLHCAAHCTVTRFIGCSYCFAVRLVFLYFIYLFIFVFDFVIIGSCTMLLAASF